VKYVCIKKHRGRFPVTMMCRLLGVSKKRSRRLLVKIRAIFKRRRRAYGSPRIWRELVAGGEVVGLGQVARLMREDGLRAKQARKFKNTTDSNHNLPVAPNILGGMAPVSQENEVWVTDITYLWTRMGWT